MSAFLDLVKAFDRVPRALLWKLLGKFGVPHKLIRLLKALHQDVVVKFEVEGVVHEVKCSIARRYSGTSVFYHIHCRKHDGLEESLPSSSLSDEVRQHSYWTESQGRR